MNDRRYWAFLSYSHADRRWAQWLHRALEGYNVPKRLVGRSTSMGPAPRRFSPIFRDREELTADAHLGARIEEALGASAFLIVLCTPSAAQSRWVEQEIVRFQQTHGDDRVLAVIAGGDPHASDRPGQEARECFPRALRVRIGTDHSSSDDRPEPIAADLRPGKDGRRLACLKLLARMLEVGLDEVVQRDAQKRQAQLISLAGVAVGIAAAMGGLAISSVLARNEARIQRSQAEGLVEFMIGDLSQKLEPKVRLDVMSTVAQRAVVYYAAQTSHGMDADALGRQARVLRELAWIQQDSGDSTLASQLLENASARTAELLARDPGNPQRLFDHAEIVGQLGQLAEHRGQLGVAEAQMRRYVDLTAELVAKGGRKRDYLSAESSANVDLGVILQQAHRPNEAIAMLQRGVSTKIALAAAPGADRASRFDEAQSIAWLANAEWQIGNHEAALRDRRNEESIYSELLAASPDDREAMDGLAVNHVRQAHMLLTLGNTRAAQVLASSGVELADRALAGDPADTQRQEDAAAAYMIQGELFLELGNFAAASRVGKRAEDLTQSLVDKDRTIIRWSGGRLWGARRLLILAAAGSATSDDTCLHALAPAAAEATRLQSLRKANASDTGLARATAQAEILSGDLAAVGGNPALARTDWARANDDLKSAYPTTVERIDPEASEMFATVVTRLNLGMTRSSIRLRHAVTGLECARSQ